MSAGVTAIVPGAVELLGFTLLHFLWQGAAIAAALFAALRLAGNSTPSLRYGAACVALVAMLAAPIVTGVVLSREAAVADVDGAVAVGQSTPRTAASALSAMGPGGGSSAATPLDAGGSPSILSLLVAAWCCGVAALAVRFAGGAIRARRLTRVEVSAPNAAWQRTLSRLARGMGVRRPVTLLVSGLVASPATLGWIRPVVLVPAGVFVGLTPAQLEAIFAHELAHIRRHDFLINLLQVAGEMLLFYHPAIWWVSRVISRERELACDDLAVGVCGDPLVYARALTRLERLTSAHPRLALAASGGELYDRVLRLVEPAGTVSSASHGRRALSAAAIASAALLLLPGVDAVRRPRDPAPETAAAVAPTAERSAEAEPPPRDEARPELVAARAAATIGLAGRKGSAVVLDLRYGGMLIVNDELAARTTWPAGSTFKLVTSLAALSEGLVDPAERMRTADAGAPLDLEEALARSSNEYFARLGTTVGSARLLSYATALGLDRATTFDVAGEVPGRLPAASTDAAALGGTGQGVYLTPLQLARLMAVVASGDATVYLEGPRGRGASTFLPTPEAFRHVRAGMLACTARGTGSKAFGPGSNVAGKTATARVAGADSGLFACFAPADAPRWVVVVAIEAPGAFGSDAALVAADILRQFDGC
jgi:beta-lactamase regulating signal transducer with metallopeptidase domain